jgi:hypothetical protein
MLREQWSLLSPAEETVLKGVACVACRSIQIGVCAAEHVARPGRLGPARGAAVGRPLARARALRLGPPILILRLPAAAQSRRRPRVLKIAASMMPPLFAQLLSLARTVHQPQRLSQPSCASTSNQPQLCRPHTVCHTDRNLSRPHVLRSAAAAGFAIVCTHWLFMKPADIRRSC